MRLNPIWGCLGLFLLGACAAQEPVLEEKIVSRSLGRVLYIQPLSHERNNDFTDDMDAVFDYLSEKQLTSMFVLAPIATTGRIVGGRFEESQASDTRCLFVIQLSNGQKIHVEQPNELHVRIGEDVILITNQQGQTRIQKRLNQAYRPK